MANNISYVLLILLVASLAKTDAFPENSMPCPTYCLDSKCTMGLGCRRCREDAIKFYAGTYIGFVCLFSCPRPYTKEGEYCLPTPKAYY